MTPSEPRWNKGTSGPETRLSVKRVMPITAKTITTSAASDSATSLGLAPRRHSRHWQVSGNTANNSPNAASSPGVGLDHLR